MDTWAPVPAGSSPADIGAGGFGLDNLPFGVVARRGSDPRVVVRIGNHALDLLAAGIEPVLTMQPSINELMASGKGRAIREAARDVLTGAERADWLLALDAVDVRLPVAVGDYVDFYSSIHHAINLGKILRPGSEPLLPNWRRLPVGYHGRSGTVVVSCTNVARPHGLVPSADGEPHLAATSALDIELEVGWIVGVGGTRIRPDDADQHVFGAVLLNDWSARDIQAYEYQPLGPNLGKSFATTISPWVVTLDALAPFIVEPPPQDPPPDPYLRSTRPWALDLELRVALNGQEICATNFSSMYWTFAQQLAHMTVNGATTRPGDLFGSGTVSGPTPTERGSLIEMTWRGAEPLTLDDGSTRTFLMDGDTVTLSGWCAGGDRPLISFGDAVGTIVPGGSIPPD